MKLFNPMADYLWGPSVSRVESDFLKKNPHLYLTFDDGPDPAVTEKVLRLLEKYKVVGSFFVIVQKALSHSDLIFEMKKTFHAVGNHSWDHDCKIFFQSKEKIKKWIQKAEYELDSILGEKNIGFRSPVGIRTPALHQALKELHLPLILWNLRFYDTQFQFTKSKALASISRLQPGDIILLHDRKTKGSTEVFLEALSIFIEHAMKQGFVFKALHRQSFYNLQKKDCN